MVKGQISRVRYSELSLAHQTFFLYPSFNLISITRKATSKMGTYKDALTADSSPAVSNHLPPACLMTNRISIHVTDPRPHPLMEIGRDMCPKDGTIQPSQIYIIYIYISNLGSSCGLPKKRALRGGEQPHHFVYLLKSDINTPWYGRCWRKLGRTTQVGSAAPINAGKVFAKKNHLHSDLYPCNGFPLDCKKEWKNERKKKKKKKKSASKELGVQTWNEINAMTYRFHGSSATRKASSI